MRFSRIDSAQGIENMQIIKKGALAALVPPPGHSRERENYARRPCVVIQRGIVGRVPGVKITRTPYHTGHSTLLSGCSISCSLSTYPSPHNATHLGPVCTNCA